MDELFFGTNEKLLGKMILLQGNMGKSVKGLCHKCHSSNVDLELDENKIPTCIKCRDPLNVDHQ